VGRVRPLTYFVDGYTTLVRSVPELLIIYMLFFGSVQFVT
jgi:octopine/nopaline transport system permease protein